MYRFLSLCDYSGSWPKPFKDAGYEVVQIDLKHGIDIMTWDYQAYPRGYFYGIFAAPPCTHYTVSGALYWAAKDADGRTELMNQLTNRILDIIEYFDPKFWALENPVGRIEECVPRLKGKRLLLFNPCDFGDPYTKKTILWGHFNPFLVRAPVRPVRASTKKGHHSMDLYLNIKCGFEKRQELRSLTPPGFSKAFYEANKPLL
ncbi:hypothetical protein [Spirosoma litoris]